MGLTGKLLTSSLAVGGTLAALTIYNKMTETMAGELDTVLKGEERRYPWKDGDMYYQVKGARNAKPFLLIHSFGPGASSYEWRKNVDALAEQFRVYTVDLMGFGRSDHPPIDYTAETFADLIGDFIKEVIGKPTVVVAHGMPCAYVIANAFRRPQLFERLVLVVPPPIILQEAVPGPGNTLWKTILSLPIVGQFIYNMLTTRQAIWGYYERQGYHNPNLIQDELVEYIYTSAHQPNSRYPMASFLSNYLTLDVHEPFARLQIPTILVWGREGLTSPTEVTEAFKRVNPRAEIRILDRCSFEPQDEQAVNFNNLIKEFAATPVK
jgi:pimeloyl-ACP methyl ester carboxylesterase